MEALTTRGTTATAPAQPAFKRTREEWLNEAGTLILEEIIKPAWSVRDDLKIRYTVGYPRGMSSEQNIGYCVPSHCSGDTHNEIFIVSSIDDSMLILSVLVHEIIHAVDDCKSQHKGDFRTLAKLVGLEGKMTATYPGTELDAILSEYHALLGDIPHSKMVSGTGRKKQTSRMIKLSCECGLTLRLSMKAIEHVMNFNEGELPCMACRQNMTIEVKD